eukprot:g4881.t1
MLALARLVDHISYVQVVPDSAFDLNQTIFVSVTGAFTRAALKATTGNQHFWEEGRLMAIQQMYLATQQQFVPRPVADGSRNFSPVLEFMQSKCNFKMEHADGSFYDHLFFVRDYSALHYPQQSPKILFLHSIMGVATNLWPMEAKNVPALQKLLTKEEFFHIAAFPTVLRLIKGTDFLLDLYNLEAAAAMATSGERSWKKLRGLRCMRMLDGEAIEFESMEALYTHLNFHAIHLLDFLPLCGWRANWARPFVHDFLMLFAVLKALGKLEANIDVPAGLVEIGVEGFRGGRGSSCDGGEERMILRPVKSLVELYRLKSKAEGHGNGGYADVACDTEGQPSTAMHILMRSLPRRLLEKLQRKQVARFTKEINRSLKYEWVLENVGPSELLTPSSGYNFRGKHIGWWGGVSIIVNTTVGAGLAAVPLVFVQGGWFFPTLTTVIFGLLAGLASSWICECIRFVPGNEYFHSRVEFLTCVQNYVPSRWFALVATVGLFGALQTLNVVSIVTTAQSIDDFISELRGRNCGVELTGVNCIFHEDAALQANVNSPFENLAITEGFVICLLLAVPLALVNLEENVGFQIATFVFCIVTFALWIIDLVFWEGERIADANYNPVGTGGGVPNISSGHVFFHHYDLQHNHLHDGLMGTVMSNFAVAIIVPSWLNEKKPSVSVNETIWFSMGICVAIYLVVGLLGAAYFGHLLTEESNFLSVMIHRSASFPVRFTCYAYPVVASLTGVPLCSIVCRYNLLEQQLCTTERSANFWAILVPWMFAIPLQTLNHGNLAEGFLTSGSLLFSTWINFVVPFYVFLEYNDVYLEQPSLLSRLTSSSTSWLSERANRVAAMRSPVYRNISNGLSWPGEIVTSGSGTSNENVLVGAAGIGGGFENGANAINPSPNLLRVGGADVGDSLSPLSQGSIIVTGSGQQLAPGGSSSSASLLSESGARSDQIAVLGSPATAAPLAGIAEEVNLGSYRPLLPEEADAWQPNTDTEDEEGGAAGGLNPIDSRSFRIH